jgi:hypothetical protein
MHGDHLSVFAAAAGSWQLLLSFHLHLPGSNSELTHCVGCCPNVWAACLLHPGGYQGARASLLAKNAAAMLFSK